MLLESSRYEVFTKFVREHFDITILDAPPLGLVADYQSMSRYATLNLFVVRQNHTKVNALRGSVTKLTKSDSTTALVLNDAQRYTLNEYGHYYSKNGYYASRE